MNLKYKTTTLQERAIHGMVGILCTLAIVYCIVLLSLVFSVIERKQNMIATRDAYSTLNTIESKYAEVVGSINDKTLQANNFVRIDEGAAFAVRKDDIASYTLLYVH